MNAAERLRTRNGDDDRFRVVAVEIGGGVWAASSSRWVVAAERIADGALPPPGPKNPESLIPALRRLLVDENATPTVAVTLDAILTRTSEVTSIPPEECSACGGGGFVRHVCRCDLCGEEWENCGKCNGRGSIRPRAYGRIDGAVFDYYRIHACASALSEPTFTAVVADYMDGRGRLLRLTGENQRAAILSEPTTFAGETEIPDVTLADFASR